MRAAGGGGAAVVLEDARSVGKVGKANARHLGVRSQVPHFLGNIVPESHKGFHPCILNEWRRMFAKPGKNCFIARSGIARPTWPDGQQ